MSDLYRDSWVAELQRNVTDEHTVNVQYYGAKSDGKTGSSKAFLSAWAAACASTRPTTIYVPRGNYLIRTAYFNGQTCKSKAINIRIDGTLLAPSDYNVIGNAENWIKFEKVTGVSIYGGTFDGQGSGLWACKNSRKNCPKGTTDTELESLETKHFILSMEAVLVCGVAILVDCSTWPVIDEVALVELLRENPMFRIGLDVFEDEPYMKASLADMKNVVVVPT
ncbi:hypothetical protein BC332_03870 [Capsicum chinense]|nr:hypothetical protein BC332_03870 [Capsicum chinense]